MIRNLIQKIFKRKPKQSQTHNSEEFYAVIKLVSGEEIFALVMIDEEYEDPMLILQHPITVKMMSNSQGVYIKVKSWIEMSNEDIFILRLSKVITMTESNDSKLIDIYKTYISDDPTNILNSSDSHCVKPSTQMGYLSSVTDARKRLEKLYNSNGSS